jgi:hypothetical protein
MPLDELDNAVSMRFSPGYPHPLDQQERMRQLIELLAEAPARG